uniref:BZIP domain-containing protein n=2 Tax=Caenorhabditis tropicalis TaxID=1561998 RepID=A0A1I7UFA6_9PELO
MVIVMTDDDACVQKKGSSIPDQKLRKREREREREGAEKLETRFSALSSRKSCSKRRKRISSDQRRPQLRWLEEKREGMG